uniref:SCAN box domain-containing protein n=1 Tax=Varanus komodoensis TaxID=61221 RepID=A0A8D2J0C9_VARKO
MAAHTVFLGFPQPYKVGLYPKVKAGFPRYSASRHRQLRSFHIEGNPEACRQCFRQFRYGDAKGPQEVCRRLSELCRQWLKPERRTKEQILDVVILEQFLALLPPGIQGQVREHGPETCAQAVALVKNFLPTQQEASRWKDQVRLFSPRLFSHAPGCDMGSEGGVSDVSGPGLPTPEVGRR